MPDEGAEPGANLYELWRAVRDNLPTVAREYALANNHVASTDDGLGAAFQRPDHFGGLKFGVALPRHLAVATLAARLADLDHAAAVLAEPSRFTVA